MTTIAPGELVPASKINQWCPPGIVQPYAGAAAPAGWLLCDGASYLRTDYPDLFAVLGTTYGAADGTHFNVPDLRGRVIAGYAAAGGHADVSALGGNDGVAAASRRPKHKSSVNDAGHTHRPLFSAGGGANQELGAGAGAAPGYSGPANGIGQNYIETTATGITVGPQTGAEPVDAPAYLVLNYLIRAKDV